MFTRFMLTAATSALIAGSAAADYTLTILHTNDIHSRVESINKYDSTCNADGEAEGKCFGGMARLKTIIDAERAAMADQNVVVLDASVTPDAVIAARIAEMGAPIEEMKMRVVAQSPDNIDGDRGSCRAMECQMGNLVADAMLDRVADQGIEIAIQNGGGLRASIDAGDVTMGEVLTVLPFQNTLSTFFVSGATIVAALENGVSKIEEGAGRFPQVASMSFTVTPSAEVGSRISNVMVGGLAIDLNKTYGVVSNNYVRNGGDGNKIFRDAENAYGYGPDLADVTAEYIAKGGSYTSYTDGRITLK